MSSAVGTIDNLLHVSHSSCASPSDFFDEAMPLHDHDNSLFFYLGKCDEHFKEEVDFLGHCEIEHPNANKFHGCY